MNETSFVDSVSAVLASNSGNVFQTMFEFFKNINDLSDHDLLAAYNAVKFIQASCQSKPQREQAQSLLNSMSRVAGRRSGSTILYDVVMNYKD